MKQFENLLLFFLLVGVSSKSLGQDLLSESLCYVLGKTNTKYEQIYIIGNITPSKCNALEDLNLKLTNHKDIEKELTSNKVPLLECEIVKIENSEIQIKFIWYNISKKGKKIKKTIEGRILLTYCVDCDSQTFKLCKESPNFH